MWKSSLARAMAMTINMPSTRKNSGRRVGVEGAGAMLAITEERIAEVRKRCVMGTTRKRRSGKVSQSDSKKVAVSGEKLQCHFGVRSYFRRTWGAVAGAKQCPTRR